VYRDITLLVSSAKAGDQRAFERLCRVLSPYIQKVLAPFYKLIDLEDVIQDVFLKIWRSLSHYQDEKFTFYSWVRILAERAAIDHIRSRHKNRYRSGQRILGPAMSKVVYEHQLAFSDQESSIIENTAGETTHPVLFKERIFEHLMSILQLLPPRQGMALQLHVIEGLPGDEVAEMMECTLGTVHALASQARDTFVQLARKHKCLDILREFAGLEFDSPAMKAAKGSRSRVRRKKTSVALSEQASQITQRAELQDAVSTREFVLELWLQPLVLNL